MALEQEPLADAIARGGATLRFTATAGEENGPYRLQSFVLVGEGQRLPAAFMEVQGKSITVRWSRAIQPSDQVEVPGA